MSIFSCAKIALQLGCTHLRKWHLSLGSCWQEGHSGDPWCRDQPSYNPSSTGICCHNLIALNINFIGALYASKQNGNAIVDVHQLIPVVDIVHGD